MDPRDESHLEPGSRIGAYEIVRRLGAGAFGVVYEALRLPLRKRVALKVLHASASRNENAVARFLREAEAAAQLRHPNVIEVYDCGVEGRAPYLSMEYLEGEALDDRLKRLGKLPLRDVADLMLPIVSGIAAVHERGIVHRDLKPGNIFLARGARGEVPKVLDFGIAKVRESSVELTQSSAMIGTPLYMSPEQVRQSKRVDGRSDLWSLGVILFECITGVRPFAAPTLLEVLERITQGPTPDARALDPSVPPDLDALLRRMMAREVDERVQDVREVGRALLPYASERARLEFLGEFGAIQATAVAPLPLLDRAMAATTASTLSAEVRAVPAKAPPPRKGAALRWTALALVCGAAIAVKVLGSGPPHAATSAVAPRALSPETASRSPPSLLTTDAGPAAPSASPRAPLTTSSPALASPVAARAPSEDAGARRGRQSRRDRTESAPPMSVTGAAPLVISPPTPVTPPMSLQPRSSPGGPTSNGVPNL
ncbi:MAG: protein kinase [Polyangiales bacterium]